MRSVAETKIGRKDGRGEGVKQRKEMGRSPNV